MRLATFLLLSLLVATCGQKGPLQRPTPSDPAALNAAISFDTPPYLSAAE